jgi:hypothetical protein
LAKPVWLSATWKKAKKDLTVHAALSGAGLAPYAPVMDTQVRKSLSAKMCDTVGMLTDNFGVHWMLNITGRSRR